MAPHVLPTLIERRNAGPGREYFVVRTGRRPWLKVLGPGEQPPPFEGDSAWFEVEQGKVWRVLRQVEKPREP
jgi:hypothetical protein